MAVSRLGRRSKIIIGAVTALACVAALASYLYVRYVDVVRFSAQDGRITVDAAPVGGYWYVMRPSGQVVGN